MSAYFDQESGYVHVLLSLILGGLVTLFIVFVVVPKLNMSSTKAPESSNTNTNQSESIPTTQNTQPVPSVAPVSSNNWQNYNWRYGRMEIKYPENWQPEYFTNSTTLSFGLYVVPKTSNEQSFFSPIISISAYPTYINDSYSPQTSNQNNYNIAALGSGNNAYFSNDYSPRIEFKHQGVTYTIYANPVTNQYHTVTYQDAVNYLAEVVKNIKFTQDQPDCKSSVVAPLTTFPTSFVLSNTHLAEPNEPYQGYWPNPYSYVDTQNYYWASTTQKESRGFLVTYYPSGAPFKSDEAFLKKIVPIYGSTQSYDREKTVILNVNCAENLNDYSGNIIYMLDTQDSNPFAIKAYASSENPNKLWGTERWSVDLLKQTRNVIYINFKDQWQKYTAKDYFSTVAP